MALLQENQALIQRELQRQSAEAALEESEEQLLKSLEEFSMSSNKLSTYIDTMGKDLTPTRLRKFPSPSKSKVENESESCSVDKASISPSKSTFASPPPSPSKSTRSFYGNGVPSTSKGKPKAATVPSPTKGSNYICYVVYYGIEGQHGIFDSWKYARPLVYYRNGVFFEGAIYKGFGNPQLAATFYQLYMDSGALQKLLLPPAELEYFMVTKGIQPGVYLRKHVVSIGLCWQGGEIERFEEPKWEVDAKFKELKDKNLLEYYPPHDGSL
ncbi:hypothetical protein VKT23_010263 [Stygiomarasmius scandens]|uniref:Uncharacterized protein n=1 Tax=Marasmiellus scandens TaxID=2682957 RepID=A0ABR1JF51_9AGAR